MKKKLFGFLIFLVFTGYVYAIPAFNMEVTGAGTTEVNGIYVIGGTVDGVNYYVKGDNYLYRYGSKWIIGNNEFTRYWASDIFYLVASSNSTPAGLTFTDAKDRGTAPFPTVNATALPVELTTFTAKASGKEIVLNWSTATEINNAEFQIERKSNNSWVKIGSINGNNNSNSAKSYSFTDNKVLEGKYAYRLKQIDNNGLFTYCKEVDVSLISTPEKYDVMQNYPNPFNPTTNITFAVPQKCNVKISIYNIMGQFIGTLINSEYDAGVHSVKFSGQNLSSGVYIYKIEAGSFSKTMRMTLLK